MLTHSNPAGGLFYINEMEIPDVFYNPYSTGDSSTGTLFTAGTGNQIVVYDKSKCFSALATPMR